MRNRHRGALNKSVMLGHASQTSWPMQNMHDKSQNLPDPDIFTFDRHKRIPIQRSALASRDQTGAVGVREANHDARPISNVKVSGSGSASDMLFLHDAKGLAWKL